MSDLTLVDGLAGGGPGTYWPIGSFFATAGVKYKIRIWGPSDTDAGSDLYLETDRCDVVGTSNNDTLTGTSGDDLICGLGGDDMIKGQGGNDTILGGDGIDAVSYASSTAGVTANLDTGTATGQGTDTLQGIENLVGSAHADKLDGHYGNNVLNGGGGADGLWGQGGTTASSAVTVTTPSAEG